MCKVLTVWCAYGDLIVLLSCYWSILPRSRPAAILPSCPLPSCLSPSFPPLLSLPLLPPPLLPFPLVPRFLPHPLLPSPLVHRFLPLPLLFPLFLRFLPLPSCLSLPAPPPPSLPSCPSLPVSPSLPLLSCPSPCSGRPLCHPRRGCGHLHHSGALAGEQAVLPHPLPPTQLQA